jgi:uncharacterized protein (TIGR02145 family)
MKAITELDICPSGWRVPAHQDWMDLFDGLGGDLNIGTEFISTDDYPGCTSCDNSTGFTVKDGPVLGLGWCISSGSGNCACDDLSSSYGTLFWTTTPNGCSCYPGGSFPESQYYSVAIEGSMNNINVNWQSSANGGLSYVRCVADVISGCINEGACNYSASANYDDGSCQYPGCNNPQACNYDSNAGCDDGSCLDYDECGECGGDNSTCLDECGVPNGQGAIYECGCSDIPEGECDCEGNVLDATGVCGGDVCVEITLDCLGCTFSFASNYDPDAYYNDGTCNYDLQSLIDNGSCIQSLINEGIPINQFIGLAYGINSTIVHIDEPSGLAYVIFNESIGDYSWGCDGTDVTGTSMEFGAGENNTINLIISNCQVFDSEVSAAEACYYFEFDGWNDWYLPSANEIITVCSNTNLLSETTAWSSSEEYSWAAIGKPNNVDITYCSETHSKALYLSVFPMRTHDLSDTWNGESCANNFVLGCNNDQACNFDPLATVNYEYCVFPDECGVCGGQGAIYECGCADIPQGDCDCEGNQLDSCGVCGGQGDVYECGCTDIPEGDCDCGGNQLDALGICGGDCVDDVDADGVCDDVDDCVGEYDECGVCNGNNSTCLDCCGIPNGTGTTCEGACGPCDDNASCLDECGVPNGQGAIYDCGCSDIPQGDCDCEGNQFDGLDICGGDCPADLDSDGVCDDVDDCVGEYDALGVCNGNCESDDDSDGVCDDEDPCVGEYDTCDVCNGNNECIGCNQPLACNYNPDALFTDNASCDYSCYNFGCMNAMACNFDPEATLSDGSCLDFDECGDCGGNGIAEGDCDCNGNQLDALGICGGDCISDYNSNGVCDDQEIYGCTYIDSPSFDASATVDDGSCVYDIIDNFCPADLDGNLQVGSADLLLFLSAFGDTCE